MISALDGKKPQIPKSAFVHKMATVVGNVCLGERVNIWPGAVVRGDISRISIGDGSNIQDNCVLHTGTNGELYIGRNVAVGHGAVLHSCIVGEDSLVGIGAIVLDGTKIGKGSIVAAGTLVPPDKEFPDGVMIMGSPARVTRELTEEERAYQKHAVALCLEDAALFSQSEKEL